MNILYIGPYRQDDSWGTVSRNFVNNLLKTGHTITCRPLYQLNKSATEPSEEIKLAEASIQESYSVVIQHCYPHQFEYHNKCGKNIGYCHIDTFDLSFNSWPSRINLLDEVWVTSSTEQAVLQDNGITVPIKVVPISIDKTIFSNVILPLSIPEIDGQFVFLCDQEYEQKHNIVAALTAFHTEFHANEPVTFLFRSWKDGVPPQVLAQTIHQDFINIKTALRVYNDINKYKRDLSITNANDEESINQIYNRADCLICPSYCAPYSFSVLRAMGFEKVVIGTGGIGATEHIIPGLNGIWANSQATPCVISDSPFDDVYTAKEYWKSINIRQLRQQMRRVYENTQERAKIGREARNSVMSWDHSNLINKIKELLC